MSDIEKLNLVIKHLRQRPLHPMYLSTMEVAANIIESQQQELQHLRDELSQAYKSILNGTTTGDDWACKLCHPESEIIEDGFICSYHRAEAYRNNHE